MALCGCVSNWKKPLRWRNKMDIITQIDFTVLQFIQQNFRMPFTDFFFPLITAAGNYGFIWILIGCFLLLNKSTRPWGLRLLFALLLTTLTGEFTLKLLVKRLRPCNQLPIDSMLLPAPASFSCPSGHSAASFAAAYVIYRLNRRYGVAAYSLAFLIAFSRLFLYVHFPSDVILGALLGSFWAWAICKSKKI